MTRNELIESNINLVYYTLHKYYPRHIHDEDIIQVGMIGLCKAADKWDAERGAFSNFAILKIRSAISAEFSKQSKRIKTISLDSGFNNDDGDNYNLLDYQVGNCVDFGDISVDYVDIAAVYAVLTPKQKEAFDLLREGMTPPEIREKLGLSKQRVHQLIRQIKYKCEMVLCE